MKKLLVLAAVLGLGFTHAGDIPIQWDPVESANTAGYRIYVGQSSGAYGNTPINVPASSTNFVVTGLADCTDHFIAVKAVDTSGNQSAQFSNEVSGYPSIQMNRVLWNAVEQDVVAGTTYTAKIEGANFQGPLTITLDAPGAVVSNTVFASCNVATFDVQLPTTTPGGTYTLTMRRPDSAVGEFSVPILPAILPDDVENLNRQDLGS